jgi:hypothetical protein
MTPREKRLHRALKIIECIPQAYNRRGPVYCMEEMRRFATSALIDEQFRAQKAWDKRQAKLVKKAA